MSDRRQCDCYGPGYGCSDARIHIEQPAYFEVAALRAKLDAVREYADAVSRRADASAEERFVALAVLAILNGGE
jgi:hypothetical protein